MSKSTGDHGLNRSCRIIFGLENADSRALLASLEMAWLKKVFRKKALETHPDLASHEDESGRRLRSDTFRRLYKSYADLLAFLKAKEFRYGSRGISGTRPFAAGQIPADTAKVKVPKPARGNGPRAGGGNWQKTLLKIRTLYNGPMPDRYLLFGHYLYYAGITNWDTVASALIWQRISRPRVGEIARDLGWLTDVEIGKIFQGCKDGRRFCQTARACEYLNEKQVRNILGRQKEMQKRIGEFFVEKKLLTREELLALVACHEKHNSIYAVRMTPGVSPPAGGPYM